MSNKDSIVRAISPIFRLSHPHLFKAQAPNERDAPKFQATMLLEKGTDMMCQTLATPDVPSVKLSLKQLIDNAKIKKYGPKDKWPKDLKTVVKDGDDPSVHTTKKGEIKEGYQGHWVIKMTANEDQRPGVVDAQGVPITDASVIYPGCYCKAYIYARVWEHKTGGRGVQIIIDHIQKVKDGKSFGGKKPVDQVFGPTGTGDEAEETADFDFN